MMRNCEPDCRPTMRRFGQLHRTRERQMRRVRLVTAAAMLLLLTACGGDEGEELVDDGSTATETEDSGEAATEDPAEESPEVTLQVAYNVPETTVTGQVVQQVADRVSERTDGGLTLEIFPASQLGAVQDTLEQAASGSNIISNGEPSIFSSYGVPDMAVLTGPFLLDDPAQWRPLTDSDLVQGWIDQIAEESGLRILDMGWYVGERHIMGVDAYPTPADIEGVKIRIPPLVSWERTFEALDTAAVTVDFSEVYSALQQGVVEAVEAPLSTLLASNFQEVVDQITLTAHFRQFQGFAMSDEVFTSLPEEYQTILVEEFRTGGDEATQQEIDSQSTARADLEEAGVTFTDADTEAYREATAPFYDSFPEWSEGLLDEVRAILNAN